MSAAKTKKAPKAPAPTEVELSWQLAALPTSQHRAGLAGLVMMVRWWEKQPDHKGVCQLTRVDAGGASIKLDQAGLQSLLDHVYDATNEEEESDKVRKNPRTNAEIPRLRTFQREEVDKKGKTVSKPVYVYPRVVPKGGLLLDWDLASQGSKGLWVKLWRDLVWGVLRGIPSQRGPYDSRAAGDPVSEGPATWADLIKTNEPSVKLASTYFLGAQAATAEDVGFKDLARQQFLLHFWPFSIQVYVPQTSNRDGTLEDVGFAVCFPDVRDLAQFCDDFPQVMHARTTDVIGKGYRPQACKVDLAQESGVDFCLRLAALNSKVSLLQGAQRTSDLLLGVDIVHVEKDGNNVRVRSSSRVEPQARVVSEYGFFKQQYWSADFRRRALTNLLAGVPWHTGMDHLMCTLPWNLRTIGNSAFQHDAREAFKREVRDMDAQSDEKAVPKLELLVFRVVEHYVMEKLERKYGLRRDTGKGSKPNEGESNDKDFKERKEKIAKGAFLDVRSRSGADFVDYFTGTICSVPQFLPQANYLALSSALLKDPNTVRTLTMLALSAKA